MAATIRSFYSSNHAHTTGSVAGTIASVGTEYFLYEDQESYQENLSKIEKICKGLYKNIPLSILYSTSEIIGQDCKGALDTLVESINSDNLSCWWKELGKNLNISPDELRCIDLNTNSKREATEMVLEFYMRYSDYATLGEILLAIYKIGRYDVIHKLELPFEKIAQHFNGLKSEMKNEIPTIIDEIPNGLPESLRKKVPIKLKQTGMKRHVLPIILLTFTEDGSKIVKNIKEDNKWCIIYTLEDLKNQVIINPRPNIKDYVKMVDFVVPIVTEGYLTAIESTEQIVYETEPDNLDYKYVKFIHDLVMSDSTNLRSVYFCGNSAALYKRITSRREFNIITPVDTFHDQFNAYWKFKLTH